MLELQRPQPMPHALSRRQSFGFFNSRNYVSRTDPKTLPPPELYLGRIKSSCAVDIGRESQLQPSWLTPPSEMYNLNGAQFTAPQYGQRHDSAVNRAPYSNGSSFQHQPGYQNASQPPANRPSMRPPSPVSQRQEPNNSRSYSESLPEYRRKQSNSSIAVNLRVPATISTPQNSMPQLAAETTCLFWFENSSTLMKVAESHPHHLLIAPLVPDAMPTTGFRKWVATILSTTQVAQNVILLALLFIWRLKRINPSVKGKPGSEYRLLTVALMLGNKFLDDNTYTNKTWADVSGISVQEVHVMEVEFLSNMRYSLYTSKEEWEEWHVTLGKFGTFFEKASRMALEVSQKPNGLPTPTVHMQPAFPSPPASNHLSPSTMRSYSPSHSQYSNTPMILPQVTSATVSPIGSLPELDLHRPPRKRSYEGDSYEPPAKRSLQTYSTSGSFTSHLTVPSAAPSLPRLPLPHLSIPQNQTTLPPVQLPQLPPPSSRPPSTAYPPPVQWSQPSSQPSNPPAPAMTPLNGPYPNRSRQVSPLSGSSSSSPVSASFPISATQMPSQQRLSPSQFLAQRQSPYRPVRSVHTLLVPPPSASIMNPSRHISLDHLQYQPLGRPQTERKAGVVPYMNHDAWPETNQFNQWPVLPQPNFHR